MGLEIGRRGADEHALRREAPRHEPWPVLQAASPDREVMAAIGKIDERVAEGEAKLEPRMPLRQREQDRRDAVAAIEHRHGDAEPAGGSVS